jgi:hypothetical protein
MTTHKLVSSKTVIAKIIADLDLKEDDLRISDIREWIGEAIEKIGAITQVSFKVSGVDDAPILVLANHQAALPCDLHQLHQVAYSYSCNGPWLPMRYATGSFAAWSSCDNCDKPNIDISDDVLIKLTIDLIGNIDKSQAMEILNTNENTRVILSNLINQHTFNGYGDGFSTVNPSFDLQYTIKPGYINTNVGHGYLKLSYNSVPTDDDGYPLIPQLASVQEAIMWYVTMKLMYPKVLRGELHQSLHNSMRVSWNFYRRQAYAELLMPNQDQLESIKNTWNKLVPELHDHGHFYSRTGDEQVIFKH